jgi:hypothetical protein
MIKKIFTTALFLSVALIMVSAVAYYKLKGPHGGIRKPSGNYRIEFKSEGSKLFAWLYNSKKEPINNDGFACKALLFFEDGTSVDAVLVPFEKDGFSSSSEVSKFNSCRITFTFHDKNISAIFEGEEIIVMGQK